MFNRGDSIAQESKTAKLKRESRKMNDLAQLIYWSDVGREGAKHFEQLLQQKKMAQTLNATIAGDISVEKAQKMIAKAIEVQKKADAARAAKLYKNSSSSLLSRNRSSKRGGSSRTDRQSQRAPRGRQRSQFASASRHGANRSTGGSRSGSSSKRSHGGARA